jgi:DNA-binding MarR family transcriptional regulator
MTHTRPLTPRQSEVYDFIKAFPLSRDGLRPTLKEIATHHQISVKRALDHVRRLESLGLVQRSEGHRTIKAVDKGLG